MISCEINQQKKIKVDQSKIKEKTIQTLIKEDNKDKLTLLNNFEKINYVLGDPYFIKGVKYIPREDYLYNKTGLATFYGKELHNVKTINNDLNKVTELLGRHKTLPIPSIVKVTNLENGLSIIVKINDRHNDNSSVIQVSRKVAQLLRFYKNKIARVRIDILADPSKQMKIVAESMNQPSFDKTINSAPTESVEISNLEENNYDKESNIYYETAVEIGFEEVDSNNLFLKIFGFKSNEEALNIINELKINLESSTLKENDSFSIIFGPLTNEEANNLVLTFISKGYKKTEIIIE